MPAMIHVCLSSDHDTDLYLLYFIRQLFVDQFPLAARNIFVLHFIPPIYLKLDHWSRWTGLHLVFKKTYVTALPHPSNTHKRTHNYTHTQMNQCNVNLPVWIMLCSSLCMLNDASDLLQDSRLIKQTSCHGCGHELFSTWPNRHDIWTQIAFVAG